MTNIAAKPVWNGKDYVMEVHRDVHSLGSYAQKGFYVYNDPAQVLAGIREGRYLTYWTERKRAAMVAFLEGEVNAAG